MEVRLLIHLPLGLEPGLDGATARQRNALEHASVKAATSVIATSNWAAAELRRRHRLQHVAVAQPGVEPAALAHGSRPPRLLQVGALTPGKNQLALVNALSGLTGEPWTVRLVGSLTRDPQYAGQVQRAVRDAGLAERILLTGEQTGGALEDQWQAADLSILPSSVETYGMVVTESLARGIPVIVTAGTGAEETLGHDRRGQRPGFAVALGESDGLRTVLAQWLRNPAARTAVRQAAENRRATLTGWDKTARDVVAALP
jgi:glycosyltransferase involved in cell wall biosynthesis